ncbi:DUF6082 family protein [Streptomyces sp. ME02-6987-2C]|uniref:DUF6082 family protein n=1 Tax=unclassified Streptomyces TaxID=2593676 RepID=UPI0029B8CF71|nr:MULTISPECIES: DUF6082 family protein [unclassified Streptomyces]MDX3367608.1 DUF6082 family protein [Streptomyces sp. ME02-6987-2C]MDX3425781.1 DUF6082 family protein [Streptomyces sp. ME02-6985-2c]
MKLTTAVLAAGAALSFTTAMAGAARLRQDARHQAERHEALLAGNQPDWLNRVSTNGDLTELWKPEDMKAGEYMQLMSANRLICALSLRHCLGRVRDGQLPFYAAMVMSSDVCRRYWQRFGELRAQEAEGDERAEHFTLVLDQAAKNHPQAQPTVA